MNKVLEYIIRAKDATGGAVSSSLSKIKSLGAGFLQQAANVRAAFGMLSDVARSFASVFARAVGEAFNVERAVANFRTLLGSADAAKEHVAALREFAATTPLEFKGISEASKLLLSFGATADEVMPALRMLGDISLGDSQKFQGLALVFAQVRAAGRLMGQDLLQMINQGFNPLTVIAQQTGRSVGELKKLMEDGAISFEMVEAAMRSATSEGGLFAGAMEEASKTGGGLVSTLRDNWTEAVGTFGEAFSDAAKGGLQTLIDKLGELVENGDVEVWAERVASAMSGIAETAGAAAKAVSAVWNYGGLSDAWHGLKATSKQVGATVGGFVGGVANGGGVWESLKAAWAQGNEEFNDEAAKGFWTKKAGRAGWGGDALRTAVGLDDLAEEEARRRGRERARAKAGNKTAAGSKPAGKSIADMLAEGEAEAARKRAEKEAEAARKLAERKAADEAAALERERRERERIEREIHAQRVRLLSDELKTRESESSAAEARLAAARAKVQQAWGWYRDKDSLAAQIAEEKADAEARKQYEIDFERLKSRRRDWRTADDLSLDDEAVRRVAVAKEEERAAQEYARRTAENTARAAEALEAIQEAFDEGGE